MKTLIQALAVIFIAFTHVWAWSANRENESAIVEISQDIRGAFQREDFAVIEMRYAKFLKESAALPDGFPKSRLVMGTLMSMGFRALRSIRWPPILRRRSTNIGQFSKALAIAGKRHTPNLPCPRWRCLEFILVTDFRIAVVARPVQSAPIAGRNTMNILIVPRRRSQTRQSARTRIWLGIAPRFNWRNSKGCNQAILWPW